MRSKHQCITPFTHASLELLEQLFIVNFFDNVGFDVMTFLNDAVSMVKR